MRLLARDRLFDPAFFPTHTALSIFIFGRLMPAMILKNQSYVFVLE
jgi:hypothetical protein